MIYIYIICKEAVYFSTGCSSWRLMNWMRKLWGSFPKYTEYSIKEWSRILHKRVIQTANRFIPRHSFFPVLQQTRVLFWLRNDDVLHTIVVIHFLVSIPRILLCMVCWWRNTNAFSRKLCIEILRDLSEDQQHGLSKQLVKPKSLQKNWVQPYT